MRVNVDAKLLAHVNNDAHLVGTENLEGNTLGITIGFLNECIQETRENKTGFNITPWKEQFDQLSPKLEALGKLSESLTQLRDKIKSQNDENREKSIREFSGESAEKITNLREGDSLMLPGGWIGEPHGHAMLYEFRKDQEGNLFFIVHNDGAGIEYHAKVPDFDKDMYSPVKTYKIPKEQISKEKIKFYVAELFKPNIESCLKDAKIKRNREYNQKRLYTEIFPKIAFLN